MGHVGRRIPADDIRWAVGELGLGGAEAALPPATVRWLVRGEEVPPPGLLDSAAGPRRL